ncbi:DsrE family protein [Thermaerobacter marianensis DSM 12885]|uniref:DsrE family protein n=1 Tax=Thermaerobacter marianensis (strain ATCC 700841 / DSM 12885 / JCM 10246 / 7p75a) TaxID=644966 RepID=E6SM49_THEM7|nr:DsrE/DsrF/DrsH-like family protein [Thermaerobacter marianensis]ADU50379.1 DsrE family protein [Thermaerobacter marianensis DSM 12885]
MSVRRVAIIASHGNIDDAYKVLNIATAAAAMGAEVQVFFTFDGLKIIHKEANRQLPVPEHLQPALEGFKKNNVPSVPELLEIARESGVKLIGCQMTMDVMGIGLDELVDGVEPGGAAAFLAFAAEADVNVTF